MGKLALVVATVISIACSSACSTESGPSPSSSQSTTTSATASSAAPTTPPQAAADWDIAYGRPSDVDLDAIAIHVMKTDGSGDRELIANAAWPSVAADGTIAYVTGGDNDESAINVADQDGTNARAIFTADPEKTELTLAPALSRDGKRIAFFAGAVFGTAGITVGNVDGTGLGRVVDVPLAENFGVTFSPDGQTLLYTDIRGEGEGLSNSFLYTVGVDGSDPKLLGGQPGAGSPDYSPDGTQIVYDAVAGGTGAIHVMNSDGTNDRKIADAAGDTLISAVWSPDGKHIVFSDKSERDGKELWSLYSMNPDGSDRKLVAEPGLFPAFRPAVA